MNENFEIDFAEKAARKATIYGLVTGLVFYLLYVNGIFQGSGRSFRDESYAFALIFGLFSAALGFLSGMTIYKSHNTSGHFLMPLIALIHFFLWSKVDGNNFGEVILHSIYLILDTIIALAVFFGIGLALMWVKNGR